MTEKSSILLKGRAGVTLLLMLIGCTESVVVPPGPNVGDPCVDATECTGGLTCIDDERFPAGYCSELCAERECPEGANCVDIYGLALCLQGCTGDAECREDYQCWRGTCRPPCVGPGACGEAGARCEDGRCVGEECVEDSDCNGMAVCEGGMCVTRDAAIPDADPPGDCGDGCPAGEICLPASLGGRCAQECVDRGSCGSADLACSPVELDTDSDGVADQVRAGCVPTNPDGRYMAASCVDRDICESNACVRRACAEVCDDDSDCIPGLICRELSYPGIEGAMYRGCWFASRPGRRVVEDIDLGEITLASGRPSGRLVFAAASDGVSATLILHQISPGSWASLAFDDVYSPRERSLFDLEEMIEFRDQTIRWIPNNNDGVATMLIPNTTRDRYRFELGRHAFRAVAFQDDDSSTTFRAFVRVKRVAGGAVTEGTLDLNVFLVGVGFSASEAPEQSRLQSALTELGRIYARRGISVGSVRYHDVSASAASRLAVIDSADGASSELSQLFQLSAGRTDEAVNIFLVRSISGGDDGDFHALGIAGGIPGPPAIHGTPQSGVAVSFDQMAVGREPNIVAQIMAHEIGHYLGLFHVAERARPCGPGETPSETVSCAPFGGEDVIADTARSDGDNLMWPTVGGADGRTYNVDLSVGQGDVVLRHPLVQ